MNISNSSSSESSVSVDPLTGKKTWLVGTLTYTSALVTLLNNNRKYKSLLFEKIER